MSLVVFASDIAHEQARLKAAADGLNAGIGSCQALDAPTRAGWDAFYRDLSRFCAMTAMDFPWPWESNVVLATASSGDTVVAYWKQLDGWQQALQPLCHMVGPAVVQFTPSPLVPDSLTTAVRYTGIAAAFLAVAYVAVKLIDLVPKPAPKSAVKRAA